MDEKPFAGPGDAPLDYERDLGDPGSFPFTRGIHRDMYAGRPWSIRQYAGFGTAAETNRRFRFLIDQGQPGLSTAFDLPTQMGLDSDDPRAEGEVGRVGVAIDSIRDMETMFDGIPLDEVSTSMTINAPAAVLVAMYHVACRRQGRDPARIQGTAQNDVLKEYVSRGTYIYPPRPSLRLAADLIAWTVTAAPRFNAISLSGYHMREAGCTAAQEMALRDRKRDRLRRGGRRARRRGRRRSRRGSRGSSTPTWTSSRRSPSTGPCGGSGRTSCATASAPLDPRSMMLRTHTQTAGSTLTLQQPENNIVRAAIQALAAALGGVQSMALSCFDEAHRDPDRARPDARGAHAADAPARVRDHEGGRSAGRVVVRRAADRRARVRGAAPDRAHRRARRSGGGDRVGVLPAGDRRRGLRARAPDRVRRGRRGRRQPLRRRGGAPA